MFAAATTPASAQRATTLAVHVSGLPHSAHAAVVVAGPGRFRRRITRVGLTRLRVARPGRYAVLVRAVRLPRGARGVRPGATAYPVARRVRVRVRRGQRRSVAAAYGTIVNPGLVRLSRIVGVAGDPEHPRALTLRRAPAGLHAGAIVSAAPSRLLPHGALARAVSVAHRHGGRVVVALRAVPVAAVAPVLRFDIPVSVVDARGRSASASCSGGGVGPYHEISHVRVSGSVVALSWLGPGVELQTSYEESDGVEVKAEVGLSCSLSGHTVPLRGVIPPGIPVYGTLTGGLDASLEVGADFRAGMTLPVTLGGRSLGLPPALLWAPVIDLGRPRFDTRLTLVAQLTAGVNAGAELGIGDPDVGNVHLELDDRVGFTAQPGDCSFDLDLGRFAGGGRLLGWSISTPKTPPVFHKRLWDGCHDTPSVTDPGAQSSRAGLPIALQIHGAETGGRALSYSAAGLPPGLALDRSSGVVSGIPTTVGHWQPSVTVSDSARHAARVSFAWDVTPGATIYFDGSAGTGPPPATLGPYPMQGFPADGSALESEVSGVDGPTGTASFDPALTHLQAGIDWNTWSNGYGGDVYANLSPDADGRLTTTITLPPGTGAFYLYAEPNLYEDFSIAATALDDGTTSGETTVFGDAGARFFGFYAACGHTIGAIQVIDDGGDTGLGVGEFGIAPQTSCGAAGSLPGGVDSVRTTGGGSAMRTDALDPGRARGEDRAGPAAARGNLHLLR